MFLGRTLLIRVNNITDLRFSKKSIRQYMNVMATATSDANRPRRPGVGCGVFVFSEKHPGRFLLGVRKGPGPDAGLAQLPGGHQEFGETWKECACREVLEEAGVKIRDVSFVGVTDNIRKEFNYHYITVFMKGYIDYSHGDQQVRAMEPEKCEAWNWTSWEELPIREKLFFPLSDFVSQGKPSILLKDLTI